MNRKVVFLSFVVSLVCGIMFTGDKAYSWTTEVGNSPVGHEVLTKDGAYDAGAYYRAGGFADWLVRQLSENYTVSQMQVNEAGWGKKFKRAIKRAARSTVSAAMPVIAVTVIVTAVALAPVTVATVVAVGYVAKITGVLNAIAPYYGTYSDRTKSLIAGARYQDLKQFVPGGVFCTDDQKRNDSQKYHFLRSNHLPTYSVEVMQNAIDAEDSGIKYKAIIDPIIDAHKACNAPKRFYCIGAYDTINVIADHFQMGRVLHTVQDGYAHAIRDKNTWIINDIRVYAPHTDTSTKFEHEIMPKTLIYPMGSHDRIYSYDDGFFGFHGKMKPEAIEAKRATKSLLVLWKSRDEGWADKEYSYIIDKYFKVLTQPWAIAVNKICAHR